MGDVREIIAVGGGMLEPEPPVEPIRTSNRAPAVPDPRQVLTSVVNIWSRSRPIQTVLSGTPDTPQPPPDLQSRW